MNGVDISIVVPIYNVEEWLADCLESLVGQTHAAIEIICVDDGSMDGSVAVVQRYMERDARIKLIQQKNSGTVIARKRAVERATGRYFLFVDPDDYLELDACKKLLHEMETRDCDILQYGVDILEMSERTEEQRRKSAAYFNPAPCTYEGADILRACYLRTEIAFNVIFRCFDGGLVRRAFAHIPDVYSINETDVFAFFFLAYHARKFVSIPDRYYHYRYGIGVSTKKAYTVAEFRRVLCKFDTLRVIKDFVGREGRGNEDLNKACLAVEKRMVANAFGAVFGRMASRNDTGAAFRLARESAGPLNCIKWLAVKYAGRQADCAEMLVRNGLMERCCARKDIRHVGLFYYHLSCGGIQRVVQLEIDVLRRQGYRVTLFLEEELTAACYPIPADVEIVYLPRTTGADRAPADVRCARLSEALAARDIDIFYSHAHVATTMLWDMLVCKWQCQIPFVLHYHNLSALTLYFGAIPTQFPAIVKVLKCADRVIALSRVDEVFFTAAGIPAAYLQNPVDSALVEAWKERETGGRDPDLVLWVGRMSWEKRPTEAVRIFAELHKRNPAARMVMVGGGKPEIAGNVQKMISQYGLKDVVSVEGEQLDTYPYYRRASVFLSTSLFEGFQLTALEALCTGTPIVAYAIPHLDLYRGNPAVVQVPQGDAYAAAQALDELLRHADADALRTKAKEFVGRFCTYDFAAELKNLIDGLDERPKESSPIADAAVVPVREVALCIDMIVSGIVSACGRGTRRIDELKRQLAEEEKHLDKTRRAADETSLKLRKKAESEKNTSRKLSQLQQEVAALKSSEAYRVGMVVTWPARKIYRLFKALQRRRTI